MDHKDDKEKVYVAVITDKTGLQPTMFVENFHEALYWMKSISKDGFEFQLYSDYKKENDG